MKKRIMSILMALCMVLSLATPAFADDEGGLQVTDASGAAVSADANGFYTLSAGTYTVSGTAQTHEALKITGDVTLNLTDAAVLHTTADTAKYAPAIDVSGGSATLNLSGRNRVEGSTGYAGIHVAAGARLTINGTGTLESKGGDSAANVTVGGAKYTCGGGAGIGGNGSWVCKEQKIYRAAGLGTVTVAGGSVFAIGGGALRDDAPAGAGIGSGGTGVLWDDETGGDLIPAPTGSVVITGGEVIAAGGEQAPSPYDSYGGAGIGSGSAQDAFAKDHSIDVTISGGRVTATGYGTAAGIGGGANATGGHIVITDGTVTAVGGYSLVNGKQDGGYGGAGIGGGDNAGANAIEISGGKVIAYAVGCAAGIGGGSNGAATTITISGSADVKAMGGSYKDGLRDGGAGIGAGRSMDFDNGFNSITISGTAKVRAYAGAKAQAIGVGSYYEGDATNKITFTPTADVWMFNKDTEFGAFWGQNADGTVDANFVTGGESLVWYTHQGADAFPAENTETAVSTVDSALTWTYAENTIQLLEGGAVKAEGSYAASYTLGNWAVHPAAAYTVSYDLNGGTAAEDVSYDPVTWVEGNAAIKLPAAPSMEHYDFTGWKAGTDGQIYEAGADFTPSADTVFTAQWSRRPVDAPQYRISVDKTVGGTVTADRRVAFAGTTVVVTVEPADGYALADVRVTVDRSGGGTVRLTDAGGGKYTFVMPAFDVTVEVSFKEVKGKNPFVDVPAGSYYENAVIWAVENGVTDGAAETRFGPDDICTRAQAVTFLWRAAGRPAPVSTDMPFEDVAENSYYYEAVLWAVENGITDGTSETTFSPDMRCSRGHIVTFLWRSYKRPVPTAANCFTDVAEGRYYYNAVLWAVENAITDGTTATTFSPDAGCTRAQVVTFIYRAANR